MVEQRDKIFISDSYSVVCMYDISVDIEGEKLWNQIIQCLMT